MARPRVSIVRIVVAGVNPLLDLPKPLDYPDVWSARMALFELLEREHIIRLDARELGPEEFDRMRNRNYAPLPPPRPWGLLLFWIAYLLASAGFFVWMTSAQ